MQYTIKSGDTLFKIAQQFYGNGAQYLEIVNANPEITDPDVIEAGQVIDIPNTTSLPAAPKNDVVNLPTGGKPAPQSAAAAYLPYALAAIAVGLVVTSAMGKKTAGA